jgi:hypothetical protein
MKSLLRNPRPFYVKFLGIDRFEFRGDLHEADRTLSNRDALPWIFWSVYRLRAGDTRP